MLKKIVYILVKMGVINVPKKEERVPSLSELTKKNSEKKKTPILNVPKKGSGVALGSMYGKSSSKNAESVKPQKVVSHKVIPIEEKPKADVFDKEEDVSAKESVFEEEETKKSTSRNSSNHWAIIGIVVVVSLLGVFVIKPGITGYSVYQEMEASGVGVEEYGMKVSELNAELESSKANVSSYSTFNRDLLSQVTIVADNLANCEVEKERVNTELTTTKQLLEEKETKLAGIDEEIAAQVSEKVGEQTLKLEEEKSSCLSSLEEKEGTKSELQQEFDEFVENVAKSICCKVKVDNPNIDSYEVVDNKLLCLEEGGNGLSC